MITKEDSNKNLKDIKEILDELGVIFYLDGGTLLGAYRDKDFCQQDQDDVDLTTWIDYWHLADEIIGKAEKKGFNLYHKWDGDDFKKKTGKECSSQISFRRNKGKVDLMFKRIKGRYQWWTVFKGNDVVYKRVPVEFIRSLSDITFYGETYKMPIEIEKYLTWRYGDWSIKVHRFDYSCYTSDRSIVSSYEKI